MTSSVGNLLTQGGVSATPEQQAAGRWTTGQGIVSGLNAMQGGPSLSTNETQLAGVGPAFAGAQQVAQSSLADTAAQQQFLNQQFNQLSSGLGGLIGGAGRILSKA